MDNNNHLLANQIKQDICLALGYNSKQPPVTIGEIQAAKAIGVKPSTLSVWRSVGRYDLSYTKVGRLVRYRLDDLAEFMAQRTQCHTGEVTGGSE